MATYRWKAGDTEPFETILRDGGAVIPLSGAAVRFHVRPYAGGATEVVTCTVVDPLTGKILVPPPVYFLTPGVYDSEFGVRFAPGTSDETQITVPNGNAGDRYDRWEVLAQLA